MLIKFRYTLLRRRRTDGGQTAVEYAMVLGAIALAALAALRMLAHGVLYSPGFATGGAFAHVSRAHADQLQDPPVRVAGKSHTIILDDEQQLLRVRSRESAKSGSQSPK